MIIMTLEQLKERVENAIEELGDDYVVIQGDKVGSFHITSPRGGKFKDFVYLSGKQAYLKEAFNVDGTKPIDKAVASFDNILLFRKEHISKLGFEKLEEGLEGASE